LNTFNSRHPRNQTGATVVEYALLVALIAVVCIAVVTALGKRASTGIPEFGDDATYDSGHMIVTYRDTIKVDGEEVEVDCTSRYVEGTGTLRAYATGATACFDEDGSLMP
jgi:Flp pilus assembly pilin Flp